MFEFGRELKRILGAESDGGSLDAALLELLDPAMLAAQARQTAIDAGRVSARHPYGAWMKASALWREHARRTGDAASLRHAATAAESSARVAQTAAEAGRAAMEQGLASLAGVDLYGDLALLEAAEARFRVAAKCEGDALYEARLDAGWARLASRRALSADSYDAALEAAALFDRAVHRLDEIAGARFGGAARMEAALCRIERADLLSGFGLRLHDGRLIEKACGDLEALLSELNPDFEPLTWARAAELKGAGLAAVGELNGAPEKIAEGVSTLALASEAFLREHSPMDWARTRHALALTLQALGEACDSDAAFDSAETAFAEAATIASGAHLAIRATVANNRAACMARMAERRGDLGSLTRAEACFKAELAAVDPSADPVSWAILQVNLARVYEARAELLGGFVQRESAVYALEEALEVFCDLGLKSLAETATAALERISATG